MNAYAARRSLFRFHGALMVAAVCCIAGSIASADPPSSSRKTALVRAVEKAEPSIVNIRGQKTIRGDRSASPNREVNGMGTGVIVDERGYILTNNHVVADVHDIRVTLVDGRSFPARVVSYDPKTDLAVMKIAAGGPLPVIDVGTSSDLMRAEPVIAIGNAFGYENTITRGVISALHRSVQVSDTQQYDDLIQTDASINPGNSGGPLLNIDGQMIGVNVAVRAGAQGIGFAIPVDAAMEAASRLMSVERLEGKWHGIVGRVSSEGGVAVQQIAAGSPAAAGTIQPGDVIQKAGDMSIRRPLDLERAMLDRAIGEEVELVVERKGQPLTLSLLVAKRSSNRPSIDSRNWNILGMQLATAEARDVQRQSTRYRGGLSVVSVREDGPAKKQGIRPGDILVGMHVWETISLDNVEYILNRPDFEQITPVKFYVIRDGVTLIGRMPLDGSVK